MTERPSFLPYGRQTVTEEDIAAVAAVLRSDFLTQGPVVTAFENALAERVEAPHAVACANGTAALHLCYLALDMRPGDAVVVPAITFLATASAAHFAGAEVEFCDVDPETGLTDADRVEAAIARAEARGVRVRAVAPVHLAGQTADVAAIAPVAAAHGAVIIEDACHAVGTRSEGAAVGACAHSLATVFSFHPVKTIAAGEGGAVTTRDEAFAKRVRRLCNHGIVREPGEFLHPETGSDPDGAIGPWYHEMPEPGLNYRLTDIHSALALSQLRRIDALVARRAALVDRYARLLAPLAPWVRPIGRVPDCAPAWHLCVALIDFAGLGIARGRVMTTLRERGIGTQVLYIPIHRQPFWRARVATPALPGADAYYARALALPLFPAMRDADVDRVVAELAAALGLG
jgi:UDP-4-amino-4,6-dideoxy-N-acetyl-beta-L-altrosamine transaminase